MSALTSKAAVLQETASKALVFRVRPLRLLWQERPGQAKGTNHTPEHGGFPANTVCGCNVLSHLPLLQGKAAINATQRGGPKAYGGARTVINVSRDEKQRWSVEGTVVQGQEQWGVCI